MANLATSNKAGDGSSSGFDWGALIQSLGSIGVDVSALLGNKQNNQYNDAIRRSDPFGPHREHYGDLLDTEMGKPRTDFAKPVQDEAHLTAGLDFGVPKLADKANQIAGTDYNAGIRAFMADPSSILRDPVFQASLNQGLEGVSRQAGAAGMGASGNRLAELEKYGQTAAYGAEKDHITQLMEMAGIQQRGDSLALSGLSQTTQAGLASNQQSFNQTLQSQGFAANQNQQNISNLMNLAGVNINPSQAANLQLSRGAAGTNTAGNLLTSGGQLVSQLANALRGSGIDISSLDFSQLQSDPSAFLQSIGIDPTDPNNAELLNLFSSSGTNPLMNFNNDYSGLGLSDSTDLLFHDIDFTSLFGGGP